MFVQTCSQIFIAFADLLQKQEGLINTVIFRPHRVHRFQRCGLSLPMFRGLCVLSVCASVFRASTSCAETAEPIKMSLGVWTHSGRSKEPCIW